MHHNFRFYPKLYYIVLSIIYELVIFGRGFDSLIGLFEIVFPTTLGKLTLFFILVNFNVFLRGDPEVAERCDPGDAEVLDAEWCDPGDAEVLDAERCDPGDTEVLDAEWCDPGDTEVLDAERCDPGDTGVLDAERCDVGDAEVLDAERGDLDAERVDLKIGLCF